MKNEYLIFFILLAWFLWRRSRRQAQLARAQSETRVARNSFTLEPDDSAEGSGFVVLDPEGMRVAAESLAWDAHGLLLVPGVMLTAPPDSRQPVPGMALELIPDDELAEIGVWNTAMTDRLGRVPASHAAELLQRIDAGEVGSCVVLRERRGGFDLLVVHEAVELDE